MSTMVDTVRISLEATCVREDCAEFAFPLHHQMSSGKYDECSVQPIVPIDEWLFRNRTARRRSSRASNLGYQCRPIRRHEHADDIYEINTSKPERQGRPMSRAYWEAVSTTPDAESLCPRHGVHHYGVVDARGVLVAYSWIYRAGDLALVSQILGHAEHESNDVMYLLFHGAMMREYALHGTGWFVYNRHDSGTDGLRYFKEKLGFAPMEVEWAL